MGHKKDMIGRWGRWTVVAFAGMERGHARWLARCDCGTERVVVGSELRRGNSTSCGCYAAENNRRKNRTHGQAQNGHESPTYHSWVSMKTRCFNSKCPQYYRYGGRGITVCDRWKGSFENFLADMGPRPAGKTIDRIDGTRGYAPDNCRWATPKEQAQNRAPSGTYKK